MTVERDSQKPLPVIDGPYKGQRLARDGDTFTEVHGTSANTRGSGGRITYRLANTRFGLAWTSRP
jgi:hypothetical protein